MRSSEPVFIVSTGRTGTQFFQTFFEAWDPEVVCYHEPSPDLFDVSMTKIRGQHNESAARQITQRRLSLFASLLPGQRYVESNPFLSFLIPDLLEAFPKARFIWITRDPATYLVSAYSKSPDRSGKMLFYGTDDHRERVTALDLADPIWAPRWTAMSRFDRIAWYWNACNQTLSNELSVLPAERKLQIRFEDIFADSQTSQLDRIVKFVGLEARKTDHESTASPVNATDLALLPPVADWSYAQRRSADEITQPMRTVLNYPSLS